MAPRRTRGRVLRVLALLLGLVVVGGLLATAAAWVYAAKNLEPTAVAGLAPRGEEDPLNLLVVHTASSESDQPLSVALVQVVDDAPPRLLALPLDLEMTLPGAEPAVVGDLFAVGGADRLVAAVVDYTGVPLHHFLRVNHDGLSSLASAAAGTACPDGECVDGQLATAEREGAFPLDLIDDHATGLQELAAELRRPALLASPLTVKSLVDAARDAVATDVDLGPRNALAVVRAFADSDLGQLDVRSVPGFHDPAAGRTTPYWEQAETVFQAFRDGHPVPDDLGRTDPADDVLAPENIRVLVLNGVGLEGLAARVAEHLGRVGFDVVGADNAEQFDDGLERTVVAHRPGRAHEGALVAGELEGAHIEERGELRRGVDVVVTVGRDWAER